MKKRGMKKRILASLMTACMIVGAVPGMAFADMTAGTTESGLTPGELKYAVGSDQPSEDGTIKLNKTATYLGDDTYEIEMTADTEEAADLIQAQNVEVAVVLDASGSMNFCEKPDDYSEWEWYTNKWKVPEVYRHKHKSDWLSNETWCTAVEKGLAESRWNIVKNAINETISSEKLGDNISFHYVYFKGKEDGWKSDVGTTDSSYSKITPFGKTPLMEGISKGIDTLAEKETKNKVLVVLADGASDDGYRSEKLKQFKKNGGTVYTIGFNFSDKKFSALASGKENAFDVSNAENLTDALSKIGANLTSAIVDPLGDDVTLVIPENESESAVSANVGTVSSETADGKTIIKWSGDLGEKVTLTYQVKLTDEAKKKDGTIYLNGDASFQYSYTENGTGKNMSIRFPKPYLEAEEEVPEKPEKPEPPAATDLPMITVACSNENREHELKSETYPISEEFTIGDVTEEDGTYVSEVTVRSWYYAEKFNETSGVKHPVAVDDVTFQMRWNAETGKWKPVATSLKPIIVNCSGSEVPETPELPSEGEVKSLVEKVVLVHTGSNAEHKDAEYDLKDGSYEITRLGAEKAAVTVNADSYVKDYNEENGTHTVQGRTSVKLVLKHAENGWTVEEGENTVSFTVKCTGTTPDEPVKPEKPELPKYDELKKLFGEAITVTCTTDADHAAETFGLMAGSYGVTRDKEEDDVAVVTIRAAKYIEAFNNGTHTNEGDDAARVNLFYNEEDGKWYAADEELVINFRAKCEKKAPEKQNTEIRFVVVNGTFTENGQTEITKSFEVGHKLVMTDIPASEGKNKNYSDQTWDKYPLGYTVGEEGCTFTITYKWKSSGSDSDSDDNDDNTVTTRKYATDAAGKHGRWILEGGEFTEDNGRLPSNEYLKIGDTIYGFYTYGFAIDFDRPEYYTDAAIQAKGGYRDATGTWRLNGWWFCYDDGTFPHDEWVHLTWNGRSDWYYFDVDGWMEDGWLFRNNNWYYLHTQYDNTRGHMVTGWQEIDGKWYYFNTASDQGTLGAMRVNTTTPDGFQVDENGAWIR